MHARTLCGHRGCAGGVGLVKVVESIFDHRIGIRNSGSVSSGMGGWPQTLFHAYGRNAGTFAAVLSALRIRGRI